LRHRACNECGKYRGRVVTDIEAKNAKKAAKKIAHIEGLQGAAEQSHNEKSHEKKADTTVKKPVATKAKTTTKKVTTKNK
jgi:hypothetical protein